MEHSIRYEILKTVTITSFADHEIIFHWVPIYFGVSENEVATN